MNHSVARGAVVGLPASLLRLHRHGRSNVLVTGGTRAQRLLVVREFHRASPIAREPIVMMDCLKDERALTESLEQWLLAGSTGGRPEGSAVGTLYLDSITSLDAVSQRLLLMLAHRLQGFEHGERPPGPQRIMAGDRSRLVRAARTGRLSATLLDHLDKVRVELALRRSRGAA
ncbi:MAG: sigma 54-interacting transcriptional regulator [Candidatus Eisenbacteria bacterium]|nr:sigma 54-interacting transcriptional regulator [Candidatus Eisenbacteria bacterium]